jgi:hypothetical protein
LPSSCIVASPSPSSSSASPSHGEQYSPLIFSSPSALWRAHKLAGAAAPPPSGAGHHRNSSIPPESPITCACVLATKCTGPWTNWWSGALSRDNAGESPPRGLPPRRVRRHVRVHRIWTVGSRMDGQDRVPLRVMWPVPLGPVSRAHGAVHRARARPRPLDRRSTVRLWRFLLRAPEQFHFCIPVLPPYKNLTVRSWFLQVSPCLPWLISLEAFFLCFSTLALLFIYKIMF